MKFTSAILAILLTAAVSFGQAKEIKGHDALVYGVALSSDGKTLATAGFDKVVKLWSFPDGKETKTLSGHTGPVYCVAFSPDGKTLASGSLDKTIRLWKLPEGTLDKELKGHADIVDSIAWSPDGKSLASASADKSVKVWDVAMGKESKSLAGHMGHGLLRCVGQGRQADRFGKRRQTRQGVGRGDGERNQVAQGPR